MLVNLNSTPAGYYTYIEGISPVNQDFLRVEVHADILHGCSQQCPGCFIPRKNLTSADHLETLHTLLQESELYPDEIVIGPTDIFDAENFWQIINHPAMKKLYATSGIAYTTTLLQPLDEIKVKLEAIWSLYDGVERINDMDFKIVLDIDKYLNGDVEDFCRKLELFKEGSVQFRVNYYPGIFDRINYNELCDMVKKDFNAPVVILPSFLTDRNSRGKVSKYLPMFVEELRKQELKSEYKDLYTMFDAKFNGYGCTNYSFYNGSLYMNPFLYDGILQRTSKYKVDNINTQEFLSANLTYADSTTSCSSCPHLMSCAERNVLFYMQDRGLTDCVLPKEYLNARH
jgi:hypothetical protein|tara:strand:+ start:3662 stop:4690 length:1029 start_codon:yes stop_codon:yes gene_type:complete